MGGERGENNIGKAYIDLVGKRFGRWTVLERADNYRGSQSMFLCECDCGTKRIVTGNNLRRGYSKSCGCLKNELAKKRETRRKVEGFLQTISKDISISEMVDIILKKERININDLDDKYEKAFRIAFYEWWQRNVRDEQGVMRRYKSEHPYCEKCGKLCSPEMHHIIPVKNFGGNERKNIIWLCKECHKQIELEKYAKV